MTTPDHGLGIVLQSDSPIPLHAQLNAALRRRIIDGRLPEGSLLPPENGIAQALGVSRITVKRALDDLASLGMVRRRRGHGTEVLRAPERPLVASIDGLVEHHLVMGRDTQVELLAFGYEQAEPAAARALELLPGATVQRAVRVRLEGGEPFSHITTWVPEAVGRRYDRQELLSTPLVLLIERSGVQFTAAEQAIGAAAASPEVAAALGLDAGTPVLRIHRVSRGQDGTPVEFVEVFYNPARYQYRMTFEHLAPFAAALPPGRRQ